MDALEFLKREHEKTTARLEEIELADPGKRGDLWKKVPKLLKVHEETELSYVYDPASKEAPADNELADWPDEHEMDVSEVQDLLKTMEALPADDEDWLANLREIKAALIDHMDREEAEIWPEIRRLWEGDRLRQVGTQIEQAVRDKVRAA